MDGPMKWRRNLVASFCTIIVVASIHGEQAQASAIPEKYSNLTLNSAAASGNLEAVKYFVERGDDINSRTATEYLNVTALFEAIQRGHVDVVRYLLDHNADVNASGSGFISNHTKTGITPLHIALASGKLEIAKLLIERGADESAEDSDGLTSLFYAIISNNADIAHFAMTLKNDITHAHSFGETPLHVAATISNRHIVPLLIKAGVDINKQDEQGRTPLHIAIRQFTPAVAEMLLNAGADVTKFDNSGYTPIHYVVIPPYFVDEDSLLIRMDLFVKHRNSSIDIRSYDATLGDTKTVLHLAVEYHEVKVLNVLLESGADVNAPTGYHHNTPLHLAGAKGTLDVFKLLLEKGADPALKNKDGKTPLEVLSPKSRSEVDNIINEKNLKQSIIPRIG